MESWRGKANEGWMKNIDEQMDREIETDRLITFFLIIWTSQTFSYSFGVNLPSLYSLRVRVVGFLCVYHYIHPMFVFVYVVYFAFFKWPRRGSSGLLVKSCFLIQMLIPQICHSVKNSWSWTLFICVLFYIYVML